MADMAERINFRIRISMNHLSNLNILFFLLTFLLLDNNFVEAGANVGDRAIYKSSFKDEKICTGLYTKETLTYRAGIDSYSVKESFRGECGGRPVYNVRTKEIKSKDLDSLTSLQNYINSCSSFGGESSITKVASGKFMTCKMTVFTPLGIRSTRWYGIVPFGVVYEKSELYELELLDYTYGK